MSNKLPLLRLACIAVTSFGLLTHGPHAGAADANYGDLTGDTVIYRNVLESGDALLNAPFISGDKLVFQPLGSSFGVVSFGGPTEELNNTVATVLVARPGSALDHVTVQGSGVLDLRDLGQTATALTAVQAVVTVSATVIDYVDTDGNLVFGNPIQLTPLEAVLSDVHYAGSSVSNLSWGDTVTLDFAALASAEAGIDGHLVRVGLTVSTTLRAFSEAAGTESRISLREFDSLTITTMPEPTAAALLLVPAAFCSMRRRRG